MATRGEPSSSEEVVAVFNRMRGEVNSIFSKIGELELELQEHNLVLKTIEPLDKDRKCGPAAAAAAATATRTRTRRTRSVVSQPGAGYRSSPRLPPFCARPAADGRSGRARPQPRARRARPPAAGASGS